MAMFKDLLVIWKTLVVLVTPIVALPILLHDGSREMACLYGVVIIATLWITEALPIPVTALCPVFIFAFLGVLPARAVASSYIKDSLIFSISCLSVAVCVEKWQLHRRIALNTLLLVGSSPKWLLLGFMLPTWFLSMIVNNTSATAMMIPVVSAVLKNLKEVYDAVENSDKLIENDKVGHHEKTQDDIESVKSTGKVERFNNMCKGFTLCICYSATIGGIASVSGTSTNLIMQGFADEYFSELGLDSGVNYLSWLMCCLPISAICLVIAWTWLIILFLGFREFFHCGCGTKMERETTKNVIRTFLKQLGPMSMPFSVARLCTFTFNLVIQCAHVAKLLQPQGICLISMSLGGLVPAFAEKAVVVHLLTLLVLWLSMKFPGGSGWHNLFKPGFVNNSTPGILLLASLFIFPSENPFASRDHKALSLSPLLDWGSLQNNFPWGTIMLIGGGYAVANACQKSGLSTWIGWQLSNFSNFEPWLMILILSICISFITEITSNAATSSLLCPILIQMAVSMNVSPLYLLFPGALACSLAFMLPVATPPNAIAFATGHIRMMDMVKTGFILNFLCVAVVNMGINVWGKIIFDFDPVPQDKIMEQNNNNNNVSFTFSSSIDNPAVDAEFNYTLSDSYNKTGFL